MKINNREIGEGKPCFFVAELSGNHHQKYEEAVELIQRAAEAGADAIKLQTYTPDTITLKSDKEWFVVGGKDQPDSWKKKVLWDLYQQAHTPWEWQPKLKELAESLGLMLFSTPFDDTAVDFLERMNVPCFKIASYEAVHIPLIEKIAKTGKPVIMSIGFASLDEATLAVETLKTNGAKDIAVLHCVTAYSDKPTLEGANLTTIRDIQERFNVVSGFSDNNSGIKIPVASALAAGASIIEKHLILDPAMGGPDARFSITPSEFKEMVSLTRRGEEGEKEQVLSQLFSPKELTTVLGKVQYGPASSQEAENTFFRPSLWVKKDMKAGEEFTKENTRVARPSAGLPSRFWSDILGKKAVRDIDESTPLSWELVEK